MDGQTVQIDLFWTESPSISTFGRAPLARARGAEPERLHGMLDASPPSQWVVIDEIPRVPALLDVVHQRLDREPARRFLLTGSSARALHRARVNLLGGRAGRRVMPPFIAAELGEAFSVVTAQRLGLLPIVWTADDPEQALADYATVAVFDEVRAEARVGRRPQTVLCGYRAGDGAAPIRDRAHTARSTGCGT